MKKIYIAMAVVATAALASCQQEKSFNDLPPVGENSVVFTVKGGAGTRSDVAPEARHGIVIPLETEDGSRFVLEETVTSLDALLSETRGTPAYTENLGTLYANNLSVYAAEGTFGTATYENMESSLYPRKDASQGDGWRYQHNYNGDPWPESGAVGFYLNMPATPTGVSITGRTGGKFTFTYTSPEKAADQQDILFAYTSMTKDEHKGFLPNGAPVLFNHALTAVKFAIGNDKSDIDANSVKITKVTFKNLVNSGTCEITPTDAVTDVKNTYSSAGATSWTAGTPVDNTITSDTIQDTVTYNASDKKFGESWYSAGNKRNLNDADATQTFWLIPQAFTASSNVTLVIEYTYADVSDSWEIDFGKALAGVTWKAGDLRTYTIKIDDVNVKIEDTVAPTEAPNTILTTIDGTKEIKDKNGNTVLYTAYGGTKSDVTITNTGNTDAYIRAALIGQWLDENGNPVFGFTDYTAGRVELVDSWYQDQFVTHNGYHGYFVDLPGYQNTKQDSSFDNPLNNWYLNSDGYYYYKEIVPAGEPVPDDLFTSYTVSKSPAVLVAGAVKNVYFRLEISTQAISANKLDGTPYSLSDAWSRVGVTVSAE